MIPDETHGITGREMIMQDLNQYCVWKLARDDIDEIRYFFDYIKFAEELCGASINQ